MTTLSNVSFLEMPVADRGQNTSGWNWIQANFQKDCRHETAAIAKMKHQIVLFLLRQRESELISWCAIESEHESKLASSSAFALRCCHLGFRRGSGSNPFMHWSKGRKARSTRRPHSWSPHTQLLLLYTANIAGITEEAKLLAELVGGKT